MCRLTENFVHVSTVGTCQIATLGPLMLNIDALCLMRPYSSTSGLFAFCYACFKEMRHIEIPKAAPKKSICHFRKLEMILK